MPIRFEKMTVKLVNFNAITGSVLVPLRNVTLKQIVPMVVMKVLSSAHPFRRTRFLKCLQTVRKTVPSLPTARL